MKPQHKQLHKRHTLRKILIGASIGILGIGAGVGIG
jgi:hypothetical protein